MNNLQHEIEAAWSLTDNADRPSSKFPKPKHVILRLPPVFSACFPGAWVMEKSDGTFFLDFFARNTQTESRAGKTADDPWRYIKIKENGELAIGTSRPYTKRKTECKLTRDHKIGAFKFKVALQESDAPTASLPRAEPEPSRQTRFG